MKVYRIFIGIPYKKSGLVVEGRSDTEVRKLACRPISVWERHMSQNSVYSLVALYSHHSYITLQVIHKEFWPWLM